MSEIITNNLTGKAAAGNVTITSEGGAATMQLQQGVAKAWVHFNASTGTPTAQGSLNLSSITDSGVGVFQPTYSSTFANDDYSFVAITGTGSAGGWAIEGADRTTSRTKMYTLSSTDALSDYSHNNALAHGDLA